MRRKSLLVLCSTWMLLGATGCGLQADIIQNRHWELNETIRKTEDEQLLLNLVRLRYNEIPYFLKVSSISTQFSAGASLGGSATLPAAAPNTFGVNGSLSYSESPIVTWSLPDSVDFYGRLNAPMGADQLTVLAQAGWDSASVFRAGVKKINRLRNKEFQVGRGIEQPDTYDQFVDVLRLVDELKRDGLIDLAYGVKSTTGAAKFSLDKLDTRAIPDGLQYGLQFMTRDDPNVIEPLKLFKPLFLRFSKRSDRDARARNLRELLNLDSKTYSFGIVDTAASGKEQLLSESGKLSQIFDPDAELKEIVVNNRSMMEVLRFAASYVQAPEEDVTRGYASNVSSTDPQWLTILSSQAEPTNAWLKIRYRGSWFYIAGDDITARSSFSLINAMFSSIVGDVPGAKPLLTLPVR